MLGASLLGTASQNTVTASLSATLASGAVAGQPISVLIGFRTTSGSGIASVTDSAGNTYTSGPSELSGGGFNVAHYYCESPSAISAGGTVTVSFTATAFPCMGVIQANGPGTFNATLSVSTQGNDQFPTVSSTDVVSAGSMCHGGFHWSLNDAGTWTQPTGWTETVNSSASSRRRTVAGHHAVTSDAIQTYNPTQSLANSASWSALIAVFEEAGSSSLVIHPPLVSDTETFFSATIVPGPVSLTPNLLANVSSFFDPFVLPGAVSLEPSLLTDAETFFAISLTQGSPGSQIIRPSLIVNGVSFFTPFLLPGAVSLSPSLVSDAETFFSAVVTPGALTLSPSLLEDVDIFFAPIITPGTTTISPSLVTNANEFFRHVLRRQGDTEVNSGWHILVRRRRR